MELLARMRTTLEKDPQRALEMTGLAVALAMTFDRDLYPDSLIANLQGQALRDHAFVFSFIGLHREALEYGERADALFEMVPAAAFERARLTMVRSTSMHHFDQGAEAARLLQDAAATFHLHGDENYVVNARLLAGALLFNLGDARAALAVFRSLEQDAALDDLGRLRVMHNIASCLVELERSEAALPIVQRCVREFEERQLITEQTRSRGVLGRALLMAGKSDEAIPILRATRRQFAEWSLTVDAAIVGLDLAEALLATGQTADVPPLCRQIPSKRH